MKELFSLFFAFSKIGAMTFGGGAAMLPMLQRELVENRAWVTEEEIMDYYAVGQCTPGIIAINTATFVGYKKRGVLGGIFSTAGMVFPSFVIILLLAHLISAASSSSSRVCCSRSAATAVWTRPSMASAPRLRR